MAENQYKVDSYFGPDADSADAITMEINEGDSIVDALRDAGEKIQSGQCKRVVINVADRVQEALEGECRYYVQDLNDGTISYAILVQGTTSDRNMEISVQSSEHAGKGSQIFFKIYCNVPEGCDLSQVTQPIMGLKIEDIRLAPTGVASAYAEANLADGNVKVTVLDGNGELEVFYQGVSKGIVRRGEVAELSKGENGEITFSKTIADIAAQTRDMIRQGLSEEPAAPVMSAHIGVEPRAPREGAGCEGRSGALGIGLGITAAMLLLALKRRR